MKKFLALLLTAAMLVTLATACSPTATQSDSSTSATPSVPPQSELDATSEPESTEFTVTDAAGRTVTFEKPAESVLSVYGLNYILALGRTGDLLNGSTSEFALTVDAALADKEVLGGGDMNAEVIASMEPDVFIHRADATELFEALDKVGIPSIGIQMELPDEIISTLELVGKVMGEEERANELIAYYQEILQSCQDLTAGIPEEDKATAILMGNSIGKVAHSSMLQSFMIETAGGVNLAKDVEGEGTWPTVGTEQIFDWDPDFIFIMNTTNSKPADYSLEELLNDPAWANLTAIQNRHVYVVPSDLDSWEYPGIQSALGSLWMVHIMYPELFSETQLEEAVNDFYQSVYGITLSREALDY